MAKNNILAGLDDALKEAVLMGMDASGKILTATTRKKLSSKQQSGLRYGGEDRTVKSIDYAIRAQDGFQGRSPIDNEYPEDAVPVPEAPMTMIFGAGVPYALYIQQGAEPYRSGGPGTVDTRDGDTFIEKLTAWAVRVDIDPSSDRFAYIANKIMTEGTDATPFMPMPDEVEQTVKDSINKALKGLQSNQKKITIPIEITYRGK